MQTSQNFQGQVNFQINKYMQEQSIQCFVTESSVVA